MVDSFADFSDIGTVIVTVVLQNDNSQTAITFCAAKSVVRKWAVFFLYKLHIPIKHFKTNFYNSLLE